MDWEQAYRDSQSVWGDKPDRLLAEIVPNVPRGRILDLGMGEGRNAIFFAMQGFDVQGVDIAAAAVDKCRARARSLDIPIQAEVASIVDFAIEPASVALIISTMTLQFLRKSEGEAVLARIRQGIQPGGWAYITVFSTEDPSHQTLRQSAPEVEPNTFLHPRMNTHVHFFEKSDLIDPFNGFTLHHFAQSILLDHGHPGAPHPHYHGILTYIGQNV